MSLAAEIEKKMHGMLPEDVVIAKVQEVDESNYTCSIAEDGSEEAPYYHVRLKPIIDSGDIGVIPVPKIGSWVLAVKIGEDKRSMAVIVPGEIDKYIIRTEDVFLELGQIIKLNGDAKGGIVEWPKAVTQLDILTARVDTIINALKNSPTSANDGGIVYKAAIAVALNTIPTKENFKNLENTKVKHG